MRIATLFLGAALVAGASYALAAARPPAQDPVAQDPVAQDAEAHAETVLETHMLTVKASIRALRRSLRDAESAPASLTSIGAMQAAILAAKGETPRMAERIPEAQRAAFVSAFRLEMITLMRAALDLEAAVLNGDQEQVQSVFDALRELEDPAHEKFTDGE
jgi:hypothetical protein